MVTAVATDRQQGEQSNELLVEAPNEQHEEATAGEDGDPPDTLHPNGDMAPCSVWFGPMSSRSAERELLAQLGARQGVAVLQWPRDVDGATRLIELGIPCLWLFQSPESPPSNTDELQEWLPSTATDQEVHDSLRRLSGRATRRRSTARLELDDDCFHIGSSKVDLAPDEHDLAALLLEHFEEAVDDRLLARASKQLENYERSLFGDLLRLDRSLNQIGLEIIPAGTHSHLMRRCRS